MALGVAVKVNHKFVSGKADGADPTLVQPSKWNQPENLTDDGAPAAANGTVMVRDSAQTEGASWAPRIIAPNVLTSGATVAVDASLGDYFTLTAAQSFTLSNPTNPTDGQRLIVRILQDGTGSRILTLDTKYRLGTDIPTVVLTTAINKADYLGFIYNLAADKWDVVAFTKGF
jgi:hypothetical protein